MHQILFWQGLCPRTRCYGGAYSAPPEIGQLCCNDLRRGKNGGSNPYLGIFSEQKLQCSTILTHVKLRVCVLPFSVKKCFVCAFYIINNVTFTSKCTNTFGGLAPPDPAGELTALPRTRAVFTGGTRRERRRQEEKVEGKGTGEEKKGGKGSSNSQKSRVM